MPQRRSVRRAIALEKFPRFRGGKSEYFVHPKIIFFRESTPAREDNADIFIEVMQLLEYLESVRHVSRDNPARTDLCQLLARIEDQNRTALVGDSGKSLGEQSQWFLQSRLLWRSEEH